ncbi:class I SAM-dependent methyltransferase [Paenibacillus alkalitolerans]|uniref:class I SAM-dependent methyltransferase n=1 Tax=Paenibacillus alkalitolerans TaxID=2799335 RepID=UPI0018F68642|nr:class I SAM-dependent methyltransferase [Paenibacillus alkalitolerans]
MYIIFSLVILVLVLIIIFSVWRISSRHVNVPCPFWLRWAVELENPFTKSNQSKHIISRLDIESGMKVMDIGCGPGRLTIPLAKAVGPNGQVVAVDIQLKMLEVVRSKAAREDLSNIEFVNVAMGEGKLTKQGADRAVLVTVLGEIPNRELALKEIYDSLKPDGILAVTEVIFDPHFQSKKTVLDMVKPIGFTEVGFFGNKLAYTVYLKKG